VGGLLLAPEERLEDQELKIFCGAAHHRRPKRRRSFASPRSFCSCWSGRGGVARAA